MCRLNGTDSNAYNVAVIDMFLCMYCSEKVSYETLSDFFAITRRNMVEKKKKEAERKTDNI